jgi:plastocyanin
MLAVAAGACALALPAQAAPVRGTVNLPSDLKGGRRHMGYWRVDNGNVPVQPPPHRGETVVVLQGLKGAAPAAKTVTIEITGLQVSPALVVVGPGSVLEFKNGDTVAHDLGIADQPNVMPVERLAAGKLRRQRFNDPGGYLVRCAEYPHIAVSVIVVSSPNFAVADEKGAFKIGDAPEGKGTVKVWTHGRWVHEEPIEVTGKAVDLSIRVTGGGAKETGGD